MASPVVQHFPDPDRHCDPPPDAASAGVAESGLLDDVVAHSPAFKTLLGQARMVAPTNATVLIHGETGSGKEVIARIIHGLSPRRTRPFVAINCSAIPVALLESELFGYERGAFTGANAPKIGRVQLAHAGTLLLDEIGDMPLEIQPKLLRMLQESEVERLGGTRTVRVDVRVVAATNQNLLELIAERRFRRDLYYRLNVFPLHVPPLRERREAILPLAWHFVRRFSRRFEKSVDTIPHGIAVALERYHWPGNIRELENFIERSVILSPGTTLDAPIGELAAPSVLSIHDEGICALRDAERRHIIQALRATRWVVGGPNGAAVRLGLKRTTLVSRMEKLGITRDEMSSSAEMATPAPLRRRD
jgi:formate hydrogenlyase transcriptional activator